MLASKEFIADVHRAKTNAESGGVVVRIAARLNEVVPCPVRDTESVRREHDPSMLPHTHTEHTDNLSRQAAGLYHYAICRIMHGIPHRGRVHRHAHKDLQILNDAINAGQALEIFALVSLCRIPKFISNVIRKSFDNSFNRIDCLEVFCREHQQVAE